MELVVNTINAAVIPTDRNRRIKALKDIIFFLVVAKYAGNFLLVFIDRGITGALRRFFKACLNCVFRTVKKLPFVQQQIDTQISTLMKDVKLKNPEGLTVFSELPKDGLSEEDVIEQIEKHAEAPMEFKWSDGKISGAVYNGADDVTRLTVKALEKFSWTNPLHPDVFPTIRKMEAEIVAMCVRLYNGIPPEACGTMSSGGTESILLACLAYRELAKDKKGITKPEMIIADSAHAAFHKGCTYFGIEPIIVPVNEIDRKINIQQVRRAVTRNTIMIVGSAPSFPHGVIDDIVALGKIAVAYDIPLHVDACLGGFLIPFMDKAGYPIAPFDFRVKGVTSISLDPHKFGFTPKGCSVILYSSPKIRSYQIFVSPDWPGGIYATPTLGGSRPGNIIAASWATLLYFGEAGYVKYTKEIISTARKIKHGLQKIVGIFVYGDPEGPVIAFGSKSFNILRMTSKLTERGWNLNTLQFPASIHICCTALTHKAADQLIRDVSELAQELMDSPNEKAHGTGAIYGLAQAIPDRSLVDYMAKAFIGSLYNL